jgi:hypothetical protein
MESQIIYEISRRTAVYSLIPRTAAMRESRHKAYHAFEGYDITDVRDALAQSPYLLA